MAIGPERSIPVGGNYRILVWNRRHVNGRTYPEVYPQYHSPADDKWYPLYNNGRVCFSGLILAPGQTVETLIEDARQYIYRSMEYSLIETALQRSINPSWRSYQENHGIAFDLPPHINDAEWYIQDALYKLNNGWEHRWINTPDGKLERAIVPSEK